MVPGERVCRRLNIKEAEARSGLERTNIRFYEQEGLLAPERAANGYRSYSEEDVLALAAWQPGMGPLSDALDALITEVQAHHFEDYTFTSGGVTVSCQAEYSGFHPIDGSLLHMEEDGEPAALSMTFTVTAE